MSDAERELADLRARYAALEKESELLSERAEETLLLGLVAEVIGTSHTLEDLLPRVLERISVLKDIASCACCEETDAGFVTLAAFCQDCDRSHKECRVIFPERVVQDASFLPIVHEASGILARAPAPDICQWSAGTTSVALLPFTSRSIPKGFFVLADQHRNQEELSDLLTLLNRIIEMAVARLDNIALLSELRTLNEVLDQRVEQRTQEVFQKELQYRVLFESVPDAIFLIELGDQQGRIVSANAVAGEFYGYRNEEFVGNPIALIGPAYADEALNARMQVVRRGKTFHGQFVNRRKDGTMFPVEVVERMVLVSSRPYLLSFHRDITERQTAEENLRQNEERLTRAQAIAHVGNWEIDLKTRTMWGSSEASRIYGFVPIQEVLPLQMVQASVVREDRPMLTEALQNLVMQGAKYDIEFRIHRSSDGQLRTIHSRAERVMSPGGTPVKVVGAIQDVTERAQAQEALKGLLREKEVLLRELYHRTKNNMGVVCAMLSLRATHVTDTEMQRILHETENRIRAMALVHQKLYQSRDLSRINLHDYVADLSALVTRSYASDPERVHLHLAVEEIEVPIDVAIPCGIILNELFANAFRHAFPGKRRGDIDVHLRRVDEGIVALHFSDNGVGVPAGVDIRNTGTLGIQTIVGIAEDQLQGSAEVKTSNGVTWEVTFHDNLYARRV